MKKMTKKILTYILAGSMVLSFAACNKNDNRAEDDDEEEESQIETEEETTETTPETVIETTAETEPVSAVWGEINDLTFGASEMTLTSYCYSILNDEEIEGSGIDEDAVYSLPCIDVSEPDEDGYVTYIIDYNISGTYNPVFPFDVANSTDSWSSSPQQYNVIDYYTGTILCEWDNSYNDDGEEIAITIDNGDEEITVYVLAELDYEILANESYEVDADHWGWHVEYICYPRITLRAPESYDGMLLEINTSGWTEEDHLRSIADGDDEDSDVEGDLFVGDLTDCRFTWASDLFLEEE